MLEWGIKSITVCEARFFLSVSHTIRLQVGD